MAVHKFGMDCSNQQMTDPQTQTNGDFKKGKIKIQKCMKINKPLIPLKISLFIWYGAGAIVIPFFNFYMLQLGISISQFSFIIALTPILQFAAPTISGIIADKIGRAKPVLLFNLVFLALIINSIFLVPEIRTRKCFVEELAVIQCSPKFSVRHQRNETLPNTSMECYVKCDSNEVLYHRFSFSKSSDDNLSSNTTKYTPSSLKGAFVNTSHIAAWTDTKSFCKSIMKDNCSTFCAENGDQDSSWIKMRCPHVQDNSILVITVCAVIACFFTAAVSTIYRFMDVTSMFMVKRYNADFGRQRFWSILSMTLISPLASYLIDLTTPKGQPRNNAMALYFVDGMLVLLMISVLKLDVQILPPGRNMLKKSLKLFKNLEIMTFGLTLLVLGTSSGFTRIYSFIYLDRLGAPSILMGLLLGVSGICGLPFLLTSNWWIRKLGTSNVFLCALLGYVFMCLGYSFLENAWHALIFEMACAITYHLLWVAVVRHSHEVAPEGLTATIISCAGGIHWALGKGVGSLIGGQVMSKFGGRWAFRVIAILCAFYGVAYAIFLYIRNKRTKPEGKSTVNPDLIVHTVGKK